MCLALLLHVFHPLLAQVMNLGSGALSGDCCKMADRSAAALAIGTANSGWLGIDLLKGQSLPTCAVVQCVSVPIPTAFSSRSMG